MDKEEVSYYSILTDEATASACYYSAVRRSLTTVRQLASSLQAVRLFLACTAFDMHGEQAPDCQQAPELPPHLKAWITEVRVQHDVVC